MYKFAIIGCGRIAKKHAENIATIGKLIAVCDIIAERANDLAQQYNAKPYTNIDDLLSNEDEIDIVCICSPNGLHAEHSIKSLQSGRHVLCEKPLSLTSQTACKIIDTAFLNNKKIFVVKQNRYNEPVQIVKKILEEKKLGKIFSFQINCFWNRPQEYYTGDWKGTKLLDGGILYTQFSHFIDLLYWFLGDVASVKGYKQKNDNRINIEIEDTGVASLKMQSGAIGTLNYTINSCNKNLEGSIVIFGQNGSIKIGGEYLNTLEWYETDDQKKPVLKINTFPNQYGFYQGSMSNHDKVYAELISSIGGTGNLLEAKDAIKTIEIIEKIYAASETI